MSPVRIGTSGWIYDRWRGPFYPEDVPKKRWLEWYATQFSATEINGSFYRTPSLEAVRAWRDQTPEDFRFAWKASKFITQWKRLTAKHVYIRGHGPTGRYKDNYPSKALREWASSIQCWRQKGLAVECFFDNDQKSAAPHDARKLFELIAEDTIAGERI